MQTSVDSFLRTVMPKVEHDALALVDDDAERQAIVIGVEMGVRQAFAGGAVLNDLSADLLQELAGLAAEATRSPEAKLKLDYIGMLIKDPQAFDFAYGLMEPFLERTEMVKAEAARRGWTD